MTKENSNTAYGTLSEATNDLSKEGYTEDLNLKPEYLECLTSKLRLHPEDFEVDAFYRFSSLGCYGLPEHSSLGERINFEHTLSKK
jgi:hypothetical protein